MQTWHLIAACLQGLTLVSHLLPTSSFSRIKKKKNSLHSSAEELKGRDRGHSAVWDLLAKSKLWLLWGQKRWQQLLAVALPQSPCHMFHVLWIQLTSTVLPERSELRKRKKIKKFTQLTCKDLNSGRAEFNLLYFPNTVLYDANNLCVRWYSKLKFIGIRYKNWQNQLIILFLYIFLPIATQFFLNF